MKHIAKEFYGLPKDDLIQEGFIGLLNACNSQILFPIYTTICIHRKIRRTIKSQSDLIRRPRRTYKQSERKQITNYIEEINYVQNEQFWELCDGLTELEQEVLSLYYQKDMLLRQIGEKFGRSREWARLIK